MSGGRRRLVVATRNEHKLAELRSILEDFELLPLPAEIELPPEGSESFEANALIKARAAASATGADSIADDSGIVAAALGGRPGVHSARYAGEHASDRENLDKLIAQAPPGSGLRYVCVIAYVDPVGGAEELVEGTCSGRMAAAPRGERGFGYDPVFVPDEDDGRAMAQLTDSEKDAISLRGRAARALLAALQP